MLNENRPATAFEPIVPSDSAVLDPRPRGIYVGGTGTLVLIDERGAETTLSGLAAGVVHPLAPVRVMASSTATGLVAVW